MKKIFKGHECRPNIDSKRIKTTVGWAADGRHMPSVKIGMIMNVGHFIANLAPKKINKSPSEMLKGEQRWWTYGKPLFEDRKKGNVIGTKESGD